MLTAARTGSGWVVSQHAVRVTHISSHLSSTFATLLSVDTSHTASLCDLLKNADTKYCPSVSSGSVLHQWSQQYSLDLLRGTDDREPLA
jgi:hypothetical protein